MLIRPCHRVLKAINYLCSQDNSQTTSNLDFSEYRWIAAKEVILKSFLLPVAVAMVTTLLTLAFSGVFTSVP